jgi:aubergine-like protein
MISYYKGRGNPIKYADQPILVFEPRMKRNSEEEQEPIYLVPELCRLTGMPDDVPNPGVFYKAMNPIKFIKPDEKFERLDILMNELNDNLPDYLQAGKKFEFSSYKVLKSPSITEGKKISKGRDFNVMPLEKMVVKNWIIAFSDRDERNISSLLESMHIVAG